MIYNLNSIGSHISEICSHGEEYAENNVAMLACAVDTDTGETLRGILGESDELIKMFSILAAEFINDCAGDSKRKAKKVKEQFLVDFRDTLDRVLEL